MMSGLQKSENIVETMYGGDRVRLPDSLESKWTVGQGLVT
jgi:hypothetical protein